MEGFEVIAFSSLCSSWSWWTSNSSGRRIARSTATGKPLCLPRNLLTIRLTLQSWPWWYWRTWSQWQQVLIKGAWFPRTRNYPGWDMRRRRQSQGLVRGILTSGKPRLRPIPPNAETSSKSIRNMSNHFLDSSRRLFLSMMATRKTPHTSHQISIIKGQHCQWYLRW